MTLRPLLPNCSSKTREVLLHRSIHYKASQTLQKQKKNTPTGMLHRLVAALGMFLSRFRQFRLAGRPLREGL
jgi:hypothetical protein